MPKKQTRKPPFVLSFQDPDGRLSELIDRDARKEFHRNKSVILRKIVTRHYAKQLTKAS